MAYKIGSARLFLLLVAMLSSCWQSTVLADDREDIIAANPQNFIICTNNRVLCKISIFAQNRGG